MICLGVRFSEFSHQHRNGKICKYSSKQTTPLKTHRKIGGLADWNLKKAHFYQKALARGKKHGGGGGRGGCCERGGWVLWGGGPCEGVGLVRGCCEASTLPPSDQAIHPFPPLARPSTLPPPLQWTEWVTHTCENISFARFGKRAVKRKLLPRWIGLDNAIKSL